MTWRHGGGFSAYARHGILNEEPARLAHIARYLVRPPVTADRVHETADGRVLEHVREEEVEPMFDPRAPPAA